jgi:hypothetical protein
MDSKTLRPSFAARNLVVEKFAADIIERQAVQLYRRPLETQNR